jgi:hypothetical protein
LVEDAQGVKENGASGNKNVEKKNPGSEGADPGRGGTERDDWADKLLTGLAICKRR